MKLQAASATLPVLDWRVLEESQLRLPSIDPKKLGKRPFLKGFGSFGERSSTRIAWRESETVFFDARRAIQLRRYLPGGNAVQRVLRRVYIGEAQVRFDLASFASLQPDRLKSRGYRRAAQQWLSEPVQIRDHASWSELPLKIALRRLAARFEDETRLRIVPAQGPSGISVLQPQILLVCLVQRKTVPPDSVPIVDEPDPPIWYLCEQGSILDTSNPDVSFLFVEEGAAARLGIEGFKLLRRIRRELAWLHADLQFLLEVARAVKDAETNVNQTLWKIAGKIATGLSQLDQDEAYGFEPLLFAAWSTARETMLFNLRSQLKTLVNRQIPLPEWLTDQVKHGTDERHAIYVQSLQDRLERLRNDYDDRLFQLGDFALVDKTPLEGKKSVKYYTDRAAAFNGYFGLPKHKRTSVSVIVRINGSVLTLNACLKSLAEQTLVHECPEDIEILLIEDGPSNPADPFLESEEIRALLENPLLKKVGIRRFILHPPQGHATARNVGIFNATREILLFLDSSTVLERCHLAEHVIRHHRFPGNLALLGFKSNLTLTSYTKESSFEMRTLAQKDWKWNHLIVQEELDDDGMFSFRSRSFKIGDRINYMRLTDYLKNLSAVEYIGPRCLPSFFTTNIVSVRKFPVHQVGGIPPLKDKLFGLEDSLFGALLLVSSVRFVPCPSAIALAIEPESEPHQEERFTRECKRRLFEELSERIKQGGHEAAEEIRKLRDHGHLVEIGGTETKLPSQELISKGESAQVEFKPSLRWSADKKDYSKEIEYKNLMTIAAFLNTEGGTLFIGVSNKKDILGLDADNFDNDDKFLQHLGNLITDRIGAQHVRFVRVGIEELDGKRFCRVECQPDIKPAYVRPERGTEEFYIRTGVSSRRLGPREIVEYVYGRFPLFR